MSSNKPGAVAVEAPRRPSSPDALPPAGPAAGGRRLRHRLALQRRNRLVEQHLMLVTPIAVHYSRCTAEASEDLRQVGLLGLIRAAELFEEGQGTPFPAFARPHIRGAILHHLRDLAPTVRLPRRQAELQERLLRLEREELAGGVPPEPAALRSALGIDASQWMLLMRQRRLNRPTWLSEEEWQEIPAAETAPDEMAQDDFVPAGCANGLDLTLLLQGLEPRQRQVVCQVVLEGISYRQMARRLSVSPMTVQRLLHRGLDRLRSEIAQAGLSLLPADDRGRSAVPGC